MKRRIYPKNLYGGRKVIKKKFIAILLLSLSIFLFQAVSTYAISWNTRLESSLRKAELQKKPIMIYFYTDWCGWCEKLERETYSDSKVSKLARKFISIKVNGDRERDIVKKYNIRGYPAVIFLSSDGNIMQRIGGYMDPGDFARIMQNILRKTKPSVKKSIRGKKGVLPLEERPKSPAVKEKKKQRKAFELSGIIYSLEKPKAIINDAVVEVGDEIGGAEVIEITETSVKLYYKDHEIVLKME
ncbi:MAG: thioredoxin fold domain-containing protein [Candidatus Omnitrophota bacterium]|nr:MAG: thioredoxin fold domain-containing protein [Candidatus Omnitrophota bacterium]